MVLDFVSIDTDPDGCLAATKDLVMVIEDYSCKLDAAVNSANKNFLV